MIVILQDTASMLLSSLAHLDLLGAFWQQSLLLINRLRGSGVSRYCQTIAIDTAVSLRQER